MLQDNLQRMVGKTFIYKAHHHKVLSFKIDGDIVWLVTDHRWFKFSVNEMKKEFKEFLPVDTTDIVKPINLKASAAVFVNKDEVAELKSEIMNSIEKLKKDADYIKQASAINNCIKTLVDMGRLQVDIFKACKEK